MPKNSLSTKYSDWTTDLISLGLLLFLFYTLFLGGYPLFTPDEARYSEVAREMVATGDYITPRVNGVAFLDKPILYYWLQAIAIHLFGIKEWALRLFPVLFGIFGCITTYICGRRLFDRRTGLISAMILGTSPLYFCGTHYANLDLEVAVWISATLLFFITGVQDQTKSRIYFLLAAYICAAFAFLTKGLIGIAFPAMIAGTWILLTQRWKLLLQIHLVKGIILFLAIVLPWYILAQKANPEFLHYFFVTQQVTRFLSAGKFNNATPIWFYLPIVIIGFFPWSSFVFQTLKSVIKKIRISLQEHATELFLILWIGIIFVFFSIPHSKMITYILPIFPALALLVGNYFTNAAEQVDRREIHQGMITLVIMNLIFCVALLLLAYFQWEFVPNTFYAYLKAMIGILLLSTLVTLFLFKQNKLFPLLMTLTVTTVMFLLSLTLGAKYLNLNSAKPLIFDLKTIIQPQDEVVSYFKFHQDVPIYLERRTTIVADWNSTTIAKHDNWMRELWYGMPFQNTADWLINEDTFWQRWNSKNRVFVFLNEKYFDQFKEGAKSYFILGDHNDIILLSNQPTISK